MRKPKSKFKKAKERVWQLCRQIIKLRDYNTCQKCGKLSENLDVSHVIPKSRSGYLRYDLKNLKLLCRGCHLYWWHKDILAANEWFKNMFPERYKYLKEHDNKYKKWTIDDLKELENSLKCFLDKYGLEEFNELEKG